MKLRRVIALTLSLLLVLALFAGCKERTNNDDKEKNGSDSELSAAEVINSCYEKMKTLQSCNSDLKVDADVKINQPDMNMELVLNADLIGGMHTDPRDFHYAGTVKMSSGDMMDEEMAVEVIGKTEDGKLAIYTWTDDDDQFIRNELDLEEADVDPAKYLEAVKKLNWTMKTEDNAYVLSYTLTAEDSRMLYEEAMRLAKEQDESLEIPDEMPDMSGFLEGVKLSATVDKGRMYLTSMDMDLSAVLTGDLPKQLLGAFFAMSGEDAELDLSGSTCTVSFKFRDFDAAAEINAPENYVNADEWQFDDDDWDDWDDEEDEDDEDDDDDDDDGAYNWNTLKALDDTITIGDETIAVTKITVRDLVDAGWEVADAYLLDEDLTDAETVPAGESAVVVMIPAGCEGKDPAIEVGVFNSLGQDADYLDCPVLALSVNDIVNRGEFDQMMEFTTGYGFGYGDNIKDAFDAVGETSNEMYAEDEDDYSIYNWVTEAGDSMNVYTDYDGTIRAIVYVFDGLYADEED